MRTRVTIIGTGYVGTVAGACFAEAGNIVYCVDSDIHKIKSLSAGKPLIYEPGLEQLVRRGITRGNLRFTTSVDEAVAQSEIIFMTVGTPSKPNGEADLSYIEQAARETARAMTGARIIVNKSTVPVGTHRKVAEWIRSETDHPFEVVSNPEFLREGSAVSDFLEPERVIIGTNCEKAYKKMARLYKPCVANEAAIIKTDPVSAELTKYACNAFLATRISFMNEVSRLCEALGADVENVRRGMSLDSRIGPHFLNAGIGYGGSCFPKDIRALIATAEQANVRLNIVAATEDVNESQKTHLLKSIKTQLGTDLTGKIIAIWGLAFKPNTDDVREAPAVILARKLAALGATVRAYDPIAIESAKKLLGDEVAYSESAYDAIDGADALVLATEWDEFKKPDYALMKKYLRRPVIFDGRNALSIDDLEAHGFIYYGIGRSLSNKATGQERAAREKDVASLVPLRGGQAA